MTVNEGHTQTKAYLHRSWGDNKDLLKVKFSWLGFIIQSLHLAVLEQ
jgi:hypothetical protein